jgi:hypothetical protein
LASLAATLDALSVIEYSSRITSLNQPFDLRAMTANGT